MLTPHTYAYTNTQGCSHGVRDPYVHGAFVQVVLYVYAVLEFLMNSSNFISRWTFPGFPYTMFQHNIRQCPSILSDVRQSKVFASKLEAG